MDNRIRAVFKDINSIELIQEKLPKLFYIAELESSRAGKIGMEVGSVREKIIVSFLIYKFGENNVETEIPITEPEIDVKVFNNPISIKTITGTSFSGVKLIWTVDSTSVINFKNKYKPSCDMIFIKINWDNKGSFFYIPQEVQSEVFCQIGRDNYIKLPKLGTNPRGAEISSVALKALVEHDDTIKIPILWKKEIINYNVYNKWIELWQQN
ncbi:MAG TPA: ThaI family type II restriction endonuclease [Candidatus Kapabacteria bacterium]|jgi:hypothetical protein|nr:ThaI family type II restriction endonuclease [Candidatus Kapabacteria bacterium]